MAFNFMGRWFGRFMGRWFGAVQTGTPGGEPGTGGGFDLPPGLNDVQKKGVAAFIICKPCCKGSGGSGGSHQGSGGSGGDGGGLTECCDCPSVPDSLTATLTVGNLGTRTVTLARLPPIDTNCTDEPDGVTGAAYGYTETNGIHDFGRIESECPFGTVFTSGGFVEELQIDVVCCWRPLAGNPPNLKWNVRVFWMKYVPFVGFPTIGENRVVTYNNNIEIESCTPLVFVEVDKTVVCQNADENTQVGICGEAPFADWFEEPFTYLASIWGQPFNLVISE